MSFYLNNEQQIKQKLLQNKLFPKGQLSVVLENEEKVKEDIRYFCRLFLTQEFKSVSTVITADNPFIPFLSVKDNLYIGIKKKAMPSTNQLINLMQHFHIENKLLKKFAKNIDFSEAVEAQLLRTLLMNHKIIVMDNVLDQLSIETVQFFFPLLHTLAQKQQLTIVIFTSKKSIAESSYVKNSIFLDCIANVG